MHVHSMVTSQIGIAQKNYRQRVGIWSDGNNGVAEASTTSLLLPIAFIRDANEVVDSI